MATEDRALRSMVRKGARYQRQGADAPYGATNDPRAAAENGDDGLLAGEGNGWARGFGRATRSYGEQIPLCCA
jgi:hypothetical protein